MAAERWVLWSRPLGPSPGPWAVQFEHRRERCEEYLRRGWHHGEEAVALPPGERPDAADAEEGD